MLIEDVRVFGRLLERLAEVDVLGFDTEFLRETTFYPQLCLVQISLPEGKEFEGTNVIAVDPLAIDVIADLRAILQDPSREVVLHAGYQDMEIFFARDGGFPRGTFDTQVAAALVGYGEGMGYSRLVEDVFAVHVDKGETYTDWSKRPLSRRQLEYALSDVEHLIPLRDRLRGELSSRGRVEWLAEELQIYESEDRYRRSPETAYLRVKGAGKLGVRELAVLRELAAWREEQAIARDRARAHIVSDSMLVEIAKRSPESLDRLSGLRGLHPQVLRRYGRDVLDCVAKGLACADDRLPAAIERRSRDEGTALLVDLMELLLRVRAAEQQIGPGYVASRGQLADVVELHRSGALPGDLPVLHGWRGKMVGDDLRALLDGELHLAAGPTGVSVVPSSPSGERA